MSNRHRRQLGLPLAPPPALGRAAFLTAPSNALALAAIESNSGLPGGRLVLTGPEGSGKTHLASIWAKAQGALWLDPNRLGADLPALIEPEAPGALALDNADALAGTAQEEALFHLLNHLAGREGQILLTARRPVAAWALALPDLASRLTAAAHVTLDAPDDALLAALLAKLFADRQIAAGAELIGFLSQRIDRSFAAAQAIVARLDAEALRLRRPVTRALAQKVLGGD